MMDKPEQLISEVVHTQYFAVLNSVGGGQPYSNLVAFAITDDLKSLVFITDNNTRKYRNIKENNRVSLLIDNRANRPSDINQATAITVIGTAREEPGNNNLKALFLKRHPRLQLFAGSTQSVLMLVEVSEYIVAGFEKTQRVVI